MVNATVLRGAGSQLGQFGEAISHYTDALEKLEASGERENCAAAQVILLNNRGTWSYMGCVLVWVFARGGGLSVCPCVRV